MSLFTIGAQFKTAKLRCYLAERELDEKRGQLAGIQELLAAYFLRSDKAAGEWLMELARDWQEKKAA